MWSVQCAVRSVECSGRKCKVYYSVQWGVRSVQCQVWSGSVECKVCSATVQSVQYGMLCGACADKSVDCGVESVECGESGVRSVEYGAWRVVHIYLSNLRSKTLASALALETRKKYQTTTTKFTEVMKLGKRYFDHWGHLFDALPQRRRQSLCVFAAFHDLLVFASEVVLVGAG